VGLCICPGGLPFFAGFWDSGSYMALFYQSPGEIRRRRARRPRRGSRKSPVKKNRDGAHPGGARVREGIRDEEADRIGGRWGKSHRQRRALGESESGLGPICAGRAGFALALRLALWQGSPGQKNRRRGRGEASTVVAVKRPGKKKPGPLPPMTSREGDPFVSLTKARCEKRGKPSSKPGQGEAGNRPLVYRYPTVSEQEGRKEIADGWRFETRRRRGQGIAHRNQASPLARPGKRSYRPGLYPQGLGTF